MSIIEKLDLLRCQKKFEEVEKILLKDHSIDNQSFSGYNLLDCVFSTNIKIDFINLPY